MKLSDFDYNLPKELIAQQPACPRDSSKLMILNRRSKKIEHKHFYVIVNYFKKGDVLVLNNTKVFPARLIGRRADTGGKMEVFLLKKIEDHRPKTEENWQALIGNRRKKAGQIIEFGRRLRCEIVGRINEAVWEVKFNKSGYQLEKLVDEIGEVPTPPYIKIEDLRSKTKKLKSEYQTVYAEQRGSVAAPTAGFHFTKPLIAKLKKKGVQFEFITLHVGLGTFMPVKPQDIKKHKMHKEFAVIDRQTAGRLNQVKAEGRRIIAVGTTAVRTLEAFSRKSQVPRRKFQRNLKSKVSSYKVKPQQKWTDMFIYPGYKFKFIDGMITNFHLPKSTLLMLVSAFAKAPADKSALLGSKFILSVYKSAIKNKYRFYSFGDSMFIV